jgi:hypothetical protein
MPNDQKKFAFIQEWGGTPDETLVIVGTKDKKDFYKIFKNFKIKPIMAKAVLTWMGDGFGKDSDAGAFFWVNSDGGRFTGLYLKQWPKKTSWSDYETLMHELHHAVHEVLVLQRGMGKEPEAQAYMQETLFHQIRRKLDNLEKHERYNFK